MIAKSAKDIDLVPKSTKGEIICCDPKSVNMEIFKDCIRLRPENMTLLGSPILKGPAIDKVLFIKIDNLAIAVTILTQLQAHDGLTLPRNCFSMPKLLYILRTSPCSGNHLLEKFDMVLTPQGRSHKDLEHRLKWRPMVTSPSTGECKWLGDQECSEAATFRLFCPHQHCRSRTSSFRAEPQASQTLIYVMTLLHGPSFQVYQKQRLKFGTYRKFGIVQSSPTN